MSEQRCSQLGIGRGMAAGYHTVQVGSSSALMAAGACSPQSWAHTAQPAQRESHIWRGTDPEFLSSLL